MSDTRKPGSERPDGNDPEGAREARALGLMNEEQIDAYVERVVHEYRQEQREKERALKD